MFDRLFGFFLFQDLWEVAQRNLINEEKMIIKRIWPRMF